MNYGKIKPHRGEGVGMKRYIIYDGRGEDGAVMEVCNTLSEAKRNKHCYGSDCIIYEYDIIKGVARNSKKVG